MIRLLLDQGIPYSTAGSLSALGVDTIHVADVGMGEAEDAQIIKRAMELERSVCTLDGDFHALMALSSAKLPSVVFVRLQGLNGRAMAALLRDVCVQARAAIEAGALVTVGAGRLRVRHLPVQLRSK